MRREKEIAGHAVLSEKMIEAYLVRETERRGGMALKYSNPSQVGFPDRLVMLPGKAAVWAELKSHGEKPRAIQTLRHRQLRAIGQTVYVLDSREGVDKMLDEI